MTWNKNFFPGWIEQGGNVTLCKDLKGMVFVLDLVNWYM